MLCLCVEKIAHPSMFVNSSFIQLRDRMMVQHIEAHIALADNSSLCPSTQFWCLTTPCKSNPKDLTPSVSMCTVFSEQMHTQTQMHTQNKKSY